MKEKRLSSSKELSLTRIAVMSLGLLVVIPTLAITYLFWDQLEGKALVLGFLFILALLGFSLIWSIIRAINNVLAGLEKVSRGEAESVELEDGPSQLKEMADIINALNKLTLEFRENAAQLENFIEQFTTLTELTEITSKVPDISELLNLVLRKAMASTHAKMGTVMLTREEGSLLEIVATAGWTPSIMGPISMQETLCGKVVESATPLLVEDINKLKDIERHNDADRYSSPSFIIMPLVTKNTVIGGVCLSEKATGAPFSLHDQQFLAVLLGQIGFAVENSRLLEQARNAAMQLRKTIHDKDLQLQDAQRQIIQSEKLSALGQLIAGVAHEINNPLTSVKGYSELLLQMDVENMEDEKLKKTVKTIYNESNRAVKIVQNLLSFAREKKPEKTMADINEVVQQIMELREYELRTNGIELSSDLDSALPQTMIDVDQIKQVILNLVNNSHQAFAKTGSKKIEIGTVFSGEKISIWVSDTGRGIPKSMIENIFNPFFTTKSGKTNSGLGLSISYGIIKQHGGTIRVDSIEGEGTRITVNLPIVTERSEEKKIDVEQASQINKDERFSAFVVDDEENVARLVADILGMAGFDTTVCISGLKARDFIFSNDFDLIVSDMRMPDLDGRDLYKQIEKIKPEAALRFVFTTGDVADPEAKNFAEDNNIRLVAKPFNQNDLLKAAIETAKTGCSLNT